MRPTDVRLLIHEMLTAALAMHNIPFYGSQTRLVPGRYPRADSGDEPVEMWLATYNDGTKITVTTRDGRTLQFDLTITPEPIGT